MRVKTVRQIKNQRVNRKNQNEYAAASLTASTVPVENETGFWPPPCSSSSSSSVVPGPKSVNCMNPPYRMPPQPLGTSYGVVQNDHPIPGTASAVAPDHHQQLQLHQQHHQQQQQQQQVLSPPLRTHSSKFPIERELVLSSSNKNNAKIPLMQDNRNTSIPALLNRSSVSSAVGPDLPTKQTQAWNQAQIEVIHSSITGTIPRNAVRLPEDITALAEREGLQGKDKETVKKSVSKNYHKLKDLISSKFKKENGTDEGPGDELNNVSTMLHQQQQQQNSLGSSFLMGGDGQGGGGNNLNHAQSNINLWSSNARGDSPLYYHKKFADPADGYNGDSLSGFRNLKAMSQPVLNTASNQNYQMTPPQMDGTDSDDGGFRSQQNQARINIQTPVQQHNRQLQQNYVHNYRHNHPQGGGQQQSQMTPQMTPQNYQQTPQSRHKILTEYSDGHSSLQHQQQQQQQIPHGSGHTTINIGENSNYNGHDQKGDQKRMTNGSNNNNTVVQIASDPSSSHVVVQTSTTTTTTTTKQIDSISSSDYDRNGNHSSNVDSGRGSAAYSSGTRKGPGPGGMAGSAAVVSMSMLEQAERNRSKSESEWIDVVDAELRNILEPGMKGMMIRPESTMSESASSMSPPLPPLSPDGGISYHTTPAGNGNGHNGHNIKSGQLRNQSKIQEYGTDTYNRASKNPQPIGPSKGHPSNNTIQNYMHNLKLSSSSKKHEQNLLKKHLFGLDTDGASVTNTTRSLDLESLLGGPWDAGQSVSESETDGGLQQIRNQLEGLESMYSEVLKMLGNRMATGGDQGHHQRGGMANRRRRHGSLSSLPSSSVSGRPIRDRRRPDERRKVRDIRGINKRFQRLESHVVTLARSVAHLSSEMRSQHVVSQELEEIRNDMAMLRSQSMHHIPLNASGATTGGAANTSGSKEPMNLTNPRRVKKLTKFFGEDPPLMKLFLKKLGYEKYASIFENERVGMIELPYLGEERLQKMGIPLGPRLRILQEAQISLCRDTTLCIV
ncbi:probable cyclin-dependent serine/threonine-protein kinase DDB_G0292550 isoform X1 [Culex quinquefasciatus]|uniref:probable cyclin-dependent serine/threonine-protein kinase DDB_G0292550 isoform X1 n=2 Tax=Culex quinquefasciatus TaxID=7176 RepID=UPI0018E29E61|nr:probable cyclin-dependent serine/threonine-protein kinase DDB_G0292550 isoform X1 [Culex quinquefasciatus]XP_038114162.1 probable cyclin-dependent serine/threonine-protein kinase DDB_G0292550 isoform X1 [Culex quinquefasciatus]